MAEEALGKSTFFFHHLGFDGEKLEIFLGDGHSVKGRATFEGVRTFLFVKETDFWQDQEKYEVEVIVKAADGGIYRITKNALIDQVSQGRWRDENPSCYLILTADECFEVTCFGEPIIEGI